MCSTMARFNQSMIDYEASGVVKDTWSLEAKYDVQVPTVRFERPGFVFDGLQGPSKSPFRPTRIILAG
jgi:hypothetical protein